MAEYKFAPPSTTESALGNRLSAVIRAAANNAPRSLQNAIGPSEVGEPCTRRLAYKLTDWTTTNTFSDPWPSVSGTAIHAWLADTFASDTNTRWLTEQKVQVSDTLSGTVDLFDMDNGIVIDHKCVGATSMKARKGSGPTEQQIVQVNLYGLGLENAGHTVKQVALVFYPLGGMLSGIHTWVGNYDRDKAVAALDRLHSTRELVRLLDLEANPEAWALIPAKPSNHCTYCPWFLPASDTPAFGCKGQGA